MAPPGDQQHICQRCGQHLRYIDDYGAWFCYVCQTYETPDVTQENVCPTCSQPLTYLDPYSAWYCYTCETYAMPETSTGAYGHDETYSYQPSTCHNCGREMSSGQCYYCLAEDMITTAESSVDLARKLGASVGKVEEKIHHARRMVNEDRPEMAVEIAEEAEDEAKKIKDKHKKAKKLINTLEDDLDRLAQFDINTSTADNQLQLARNFMRSGNYDKAIDFLRKASEFADNAAERAGLKPKKKTVRRPRYKREYPACPECGNVVDKIKEECPYCDAPLYEEVPIEEAEAEPPSAPAKPSVATGGGLGMLISEKDVGKVAPVEGSETKAQRPEGPKPVTPPPTADEGSCPKCGEEVEAEWTKCPFCSHNLKEKAAPPPVEPEPEPKPSPPPSVETAALKCGDCGSEIETGWKRCPVCMTPVKPKEAAPPPKPEPPKPVAEEKPSPPPPKPDGTTQPQKPPKTMPQKPPPPPPTDGAKPKPPLPPPPPPKGSPKEKAEGEIKEIEIIVKGLEDSGVNTTHAKNLVRLAQSFMKGGSYDKAQRYIRKARQAAIDLKGED